MGFKFCPMCGEKLTIESFNFCPECGYKFKSGDEPAENNLQESVNEQNIKNPPEEIEEDEGIAKDPELLKKQLELKKKYGELSPKEEEKLRQAEDEEKKKEKDELKKWIADNRARVENREKYEKKELQENKEEEEPEELLQKLDYHIEKAIKEGKKIETVNKAENEENSKCYGAFHCHYSEQRYHPFIGIYPEFFDGICSIRKNGLIIEGKKRQKVIRFSNISSIDYKKRLVMASGMTITLSGGNIIKLTAPQEAYNRIYQMWIEGEY